MDDKKFRSILAIMIPKIIELIAQNNHVDGITAIAEFYNSKTYALLEREMSGLWHYSALTLYNMYESERLTGTILFPEET